MTKQEVAFTDYFDVLCDTLSSGGALLVSLNDEGVPNAMTIGWGLVGVAWGRPVCAVLVRPSRYTYGCIEATEDFTVNVPPEELSKEVAFCGSRSGRDYDKFQHCGFTATKSKHVQSPGIAECLITYECRLVQKNDVEPKHFIDDIIDRFYAEGDFHRVYYGEILATHADVARLQAPR